MNPRLEQGPDANTPAPTAPAAPAAPPTRRAHEFAAILDWPGYFGVVRGKPPRDTLLAALESFEKQPSPAPRLAVDLGCGEGRDTLELLRRGWRVLAIDAHPDAFEHLRPRVPDEHRPRLETRLARFEGLDLPPCDLVNASFSLPFCPARAFPALWGAIVAAIRPGGRFAGQLFGDRDAWAGRGTTLHHTRAEVERLFAGFILESLREDDKDEPDASGGKHWHVYHIVARKRG